MNDPTTEQRPVLAAPSQRMAQPLRAGPTLSPAQITASALASVSAAVVASFFGVAGTIIGTAIISIVATVGSAVYASTIRNTSARLQHVRSQYLASPNGPLVKGGRFNADVPRPDGERTRANATTPTAGRRGLGTLPAVRRSPGRLTPSRERARLPLAASVIGVFLIAIAVVTVIELAGSKPLAALVRGERGHGLTLTGGHPGLPKAVTTTTSSTPVSSSSVSPPTSSPNSTVLSTTVTTTVKTTMPGSPSTTSAGTSATSTTTPTTMTGSGSTSPTSKSATSTTTPKTGS